MEFRIEKDTMGEIQVPADKLWKAPQIVVPSPIQTRLYCDSN